jgi:hypothetical protein
LHTDFIKERADTCEHVVRAGALVFLIDNIYENVVSYVLPADGEFLQLFHVLGFRPDVDSICLNFNPLFRYFS